MTDIDTYLKDVSTYTKRVELYQYEYIDPMPELYEEATIPAPIEIFATDLYFNKLNLPETLLVIELWFDRRTVFEFNMPSRLKRFFLSTQILQIKLLWNSSLIISDITTQNVI
jgi:hypothetical protein